MARMAIDATIYEAGNGFPDVGGLVPGDDGELYRVVSMGPRIDTGCASRGEANRIESCRVELADWSETASDDEVHTARAMLVQS